MLVEPLRGPQDSTFEFEVGLATKGSGVKLKADGTKSFLSVLKVTRWFQKKKLADGFVLEYEGTRRNGEKVHKAIVRRQIGKTHVRCYEGTLSEHDRCILPICLALRPKAGE